MNPFQLIGMLQHAQNPVGMIQQMAGTDPLMGRAMQMGQGKSPDEMKAIVRNLARQKGWSDEQLGQFLSPFGLKL